MPYMNSINTNQDLLDEVLRVKHNQTSPNKTKVGIGIQKTIPVKNVLPINDWFIHINNSLKDFNNKHISLAISKNI